MSAERPGLLRRVNELMQEGRRGLAEQERIPFFCECERVDCYEPLWLTSDMYDVRRSQQHPPLILPGHEVAARYSP
ncbi:MAG: hypothetical protein ABW012_00755 [Gaiellaceae bacterium]